jgi:hypothetical protein
VAYQLEAIKAAEIDRANRLSVDISLELDRLFHPTYSSSEYDEMKNIA